MAISGWAPPEAIIAVVTTFTSIAFLCWAARIWTRIFIIRQPGWDDFMVTLSMILTLVDAIAQPIKIHYGLGRHAKTLTDSEMFHMLQTFWLAVWCYFLGLGAAKLSIVLQCLRIFGHIPRWRIAAWSLFVILFLFTLWTGFGAIFVCWPIDSFWDERVKGKCLSRESIWFFNSSFNIATDIATTILPIPVVNSLQLPKKEKRALCVVLSLGGVVCLVSCVRFYALYALAVTKDVSWDLPQAGIYSNVEACIAITASCLPTLKGLFMKYIPSLSRSNLHFDNDSSKSFGMDFAGTTLGSTTICEGSRPSVEKRRRSRQEWFIRKFGAIPPEELVMEMGGVPYYAGSHNTSRKFSCERSVTRSQNKDIEVTRTVEQTGVSQGSQSSLADNFKPREVPWM